MFGDMETSTKSEFKFGDKVRISKHKRKALALTAIIYSKDTKGTFQGGRLE